MESANEQDDHEARLILTKGRAALAAAQTAAYASLSANALCRADVIRNDLNALETARRSGISDSRTEFANHRSEWLASGLDHANNAIASAAARAFSEAVVGAKAVGRDFNRLASSLLSECHHLEALASHSGFLSYSVADEQFATKLYSALLDAGVACWPEGVAVR